MPKDLFTGEVEGQPKDLFEGIDTSVREELPAMPEQKQQFPLAETATGLGLAGLGYGAWKAYRQPFRERNILEQDLLKVQEKLGIKAPEPSWLQRRKEIFRPPTPETVKARMPIQAPQMPGEISQLQQQANFDYSMQVKDINSKANQANLILKQKLTDFSNIVLKSNVEDFVTNLEKEYPVFLKDASKGYGAGMEAIEMFIADKGITFNTSTFNEQVIQKSINEATSRGMLPEQINKLTKISDKIDDITKIPQMTTLSQIKGQVSHLIKEEPFDELSSIIRNNYNQFLKQYAPKEVQQQLELLNTNYTQIAKFKSKVSSLRIAGKFDPEKVTNWAIDHIANKIDTEADEALKLIEEGNALVNPVKGMGGQVAGLETLKSQEMALQQAPGRVNLSRQIRLRTLAKQLQKKVNDVTQAKNQLEKIVLKGKTAQKFVNQRALFNKLPWLNKVFAKGSRILSLVPSTLSIIGLVMLDPTSKVLEQEFGTSNIDEIMTGNTPPQRLQRKMQLGEPLTSSETNEAIRLGLIL